MSETILRGTISFVNYEKHFATIDYEVNGKKKSVNCKTNESVINKRNHYFRIGDVIEFQLRLSDRGDKMTSHQLKFLYNNSLDQLINKASTENRFSGYLKIVEDKFFVKEWDSYIFFPLEISPWEKAPVESADNEAISFKLIHLDNTSTIAAELFSHNFIPEYRKALQHFNNEMDTKATVKRVTPHAVYVGLFDDKILAKLQSPGSVEQYHEGDVLQVKISHMTLMRVVVEKL